MTDSTTDRVVHSKQLVALLKETNQKRKRVQSINGEIGERIKEASENGYLDPWAFSVLGRLDRMDELKRRSRIRNLLLYIDIAEEQMWSDGTGDLFDARGGDDEDAGDRDDDEGMAPAHSDGLTGDVLAAHFPMDAEPGAVSPEAKPSGLPGADAAGTYKH